MWTCIECDKKFNGLTGDTDERVCYECIEEEYEVNVSGCFTILAKSQESANRWVEDNIKEYIGELEIGEED